LGTVWEGQYILESGNAVYKGDIKKSWKSVHLRSSTAGQVSLRDELPLIMIGMREELTSCAVNLASNVQYSSAGTVE
jgi:hypothetical protein